MNLKQFIKQLFSFDLIFIFFFISIKFSKIYKMIKSIILQKNLCYFLKSTTKYYIIMINFP